MAERLRLPPTRGLVPFDFSALFLEKLSQHQAGTREWAFAEIVKWLDSMPDAEFEAAAMLFWMMGGGGTGKSVLTAELMRRLDGRVVAWHFCRHDDKERSAPPALLRSLAAMLCHRLEGYEAALGEVPSESTTDLEELFEALFLSPLSKMKPPAKPKALFIDVRNAHTPDKHILAAHFTPPP